MALAAHLTFELRSKSRLLLRLDNGEQAALIVERGRLLRGGERVELEDGRLLEIIAADEPLLEARSADPLMIAKAAYHLGNRHVAVQLLPHGLRFLTDHVLGEMVAGLGLTVTALVAPFEPEGGAYGQSHATGHGHGQAPGHSHGQAPGHSHGHAPGHSHEHGSALSPRRPKIHSYP